MTAHDGGPGASAQVEPALNVSRRAVAFIVLGAATMNIAVAQEQRMERVLGIGGFFFRARDPVSLARWYSEKLGVTMAPQSYDAEPWRTEAGVTIFAPFEQASEYFGSPSQQWMLNFRVRNLDAMADQLRRSGIAVDIDPQVHPNGRFARLRDPEGNPIELWEPS